MILQAFIRGTIVILIAALLSVLLRNRSAALRHHIWATALVIQLALLAFIPVLPKIHLPLIPTIQADIATQSTSLHEVAAPPTSSPGPGPSLSPGNPGPGAQPSTETRNYLLWIWAAGAALMFARYLIGTLLMLRTSMKGERVEDGAWLSLAQKTARELNITRPITMIWGDNVSVPITWGVLYPMILLPTSAQQWPLERRRFVLVHELAHVKRFDALTQLLAQITAAVFWFSPFVWVAEWRMRIEREHACDDTVLRHGTEATLYADELLQMVRSLVRRRAAQPAFAALAMARKSEFEGRMLAILDPERARRVTGVSSAAIFAFLSVLIAAPVAAIDPFAVRVVTTSMPTTAERVAPASSNVVSAGAPVAAGECNFEAKGMGTTANIGKQLIDVRLRRPARCLWGTITGPVRISPDERRILAVENGGEVQLREETPGRDVELKIENTTGIGMRRAFTINRRTPDDDGRTEREWVARVLPELLSEGSIDSKQRVVRMLKSSGLAATLTQISDIADSGSRLSHLKALLGADNWSNTELARIRTFARNALATSPGNLAAFERALPARAVRNLAPTAKNDRELLDRILGGIVSTHDLNMALQAQLPGADRETLLMFMRHANRMASSYELRMFLVHAGPSYLGKDHTLADAWFRTAGRLGSGYDRRLVLEYAMPRAKGDTAVTAMLLNATKTMSSGGDKATVLAEMAKQRLLTTPALRTALLEQANTLSSGSDRRRVLEAF